MQVKMDESMHAINLNVLNSKKKIDKRMNRKRRLNTSEPAFHEAWGTVSANPAPQGGTLIGVGFHGKGDKSLLWAQQRVIQR